MSLDIIIHALVGLLPVCCFLVALVLLDSYKLVDIRWVLGIIVLGGFSAVLSYFIHNAVLDTFPISFSSYTRYVSPFIEEALKGHHLLVGHHHLQLPFVSLVVVL